MTKKISKTQSDSLEDSGGSISKIVMKITMVLHLFIYIVINGLLTLAWVLTLDLTQVDFFWPFYPIIGWGIGIGLHSLCYLMYYNVIPALTKVKQKGTSGILFIFHLYIYIMVNLLILVPDLVLLGGKYFYFPLVIWGIIMGFHTLGFFTWDKLFEKEQIKIQKKYNNYEEKRIKSIATSKLSNLWFLLVNITYFTLVTIILNVWIIPILNFETAQRVNVGMFLWGLLLGIHIIAYYLFFYNETMKTVMKGLLVHLILYVMVNIYVMYIWQIQYFINLDLVFPIYSLVPWGIFLIFHIFIVLLRDKLISKALTKINKQYKNLDQYDSISKAQRLIFGQWSFIAHIAVYIAGIILIGMTFSILNINIGLLIHPAMGWMIGLALHFSIALILIKNIKGFWKRTLTIHLTTFLCVNVYLVILNIMLGGFLWSVIAILGWGIGLGIHVILVYVR